MPNFFPGAGSFLPGPGIGALAQAFGHVLDILRLFFIKRNLSNLAFGKIYSA
jgi:hypothetical protein